MSFRENFLAQSGKYKRIKREIDGMGNVEIKEPSAEERAQIYKAATVVKQKGKETFLETDAAKLNVWGIIYCTFDPETGKQVFSAADVDTLVGMPSSILDKLAKPVMEFIGESDEDEEEKK